MKHTFPLYSIEGDGVGVLVEDESARDEEVVKDESLNMLAI